MRLQSLAADQDDRAKLRHGRDIHEGAVVSSEFYQSSPFFFTREGATISLVGHYRGASAFLVGGGPSFSRLDKSKLRSVWTMTLNNATASFRSNANCIVDDPSRFSYSTWLDPTIQKFAPMASFEKPLWDNRLLSVNGKMEQQWRKANLKVGDCPNVIGYRRNEKFHAPRFLYEETINWGCHKRYGGGRSVMLPALRILFLLGFRNIYLVGVDFEMSRDQKYHFGEERSPTAISNNMETYRKLQKWFSELQPYFLEENFIVKNCNPESSLTSFPFIEFNDAVAEATIHRGDHANERVSGMYRTFQDKIAESHYAPAQSQFDESRSLTNSSETDCEIDR